MGCLKLTYNPVLSVVKNRCESELTFKKSVLDLRRGYIYGFQGQEKDDEVKGKGNSINYKYRMHDPRIGRFFAVDPLEMEYPYYSPYQFSGNEVIHMIELEGLETSPPKYMNTNGHTIVTNAVDNVGVQLQVQEINVPSFVLKSPEQVATERAKRQQKLREHFEKNRPTIGPKPLPRHIQHAKQNLNNYGQYIIPGGGLLNSYIQGEDITKTDVVFGMLEILPIAKVFTVSAKVLKVVPYAGKHIAKKGIPWSKVVESTKSGPAKFVSGTNIEKITKEAWDNGTKVNNGKPWKVYKTNTIIGAKSGKETSSMRVELTKSTGELHASPITKTEFEKLTKTK